MNSRLVLDVVPINDPQVWNATLALMPFAHVLQTWEWGEFKAATTGWMPHRLAFMQDRGVVAMAQVLTRRRGPISIMYVPKGPALDYTNQALRMRVIDELKRYAVELRAVFIKIDPDVTTGIGVPGQPESYDDPTGHQIMAEWRAAGWVF
jgi:lipid II:glycine glycyltransferase (peptidoglycan interpeptide bridge formation enzyme)